MSEDIGKLVLRLTLGILLLLHGINKLRFGISGIEGLVENHGLPALLAYGVYVGEVLAPLNHPGDRAGSAKILSCGLG